MEHYAAYLQERTNDHVIWDDNGFATYRFLNERQVYIVDIYVKPEMRRFHVATDFADEIVKLAKQRGCTELIGSVVPSTKTSTTSLKVLTGYGMKLLSSGNDVILFKKDI